MSTAMQVFRANRVEDLLAALEASLKEPLPSPFDAETILVQSQGMATWLTMRLASSFGIWANPEFPHPRQCIHRILRACLGTDGDLVLRYSRERLCLALFELLADCPSDDSFAPIRGYLADGDQSRRLQLARRIAGLFDQYALYRPEMILAWESGTGHPDAGHGPNSLWQAELWRRLTTRLAVPSPPNLFRHCRDLLLYGEIPQPEMLPRRLSIFGIDSLPISYLELINALARHIPITFFLFAPTEAFIGQLRSESEINRIYARLPRGSEPQGLHFESGHPLLASLGTVAREFQEILEERDPYPETIGESFVANPQPLTMLTALQNDILELTRRSPIEEDLPPLPISPDDHSIELHICHSRLREVEVLQDRLLGILHDEPGLEPREIIVMLPDVAAYAPFIDAVFGLPADEPRFIPYHLADRPAISTLPLIALFFKSLELISGRMSAPELLDLLAAEPILHRAGLRSEDLDEIRSWIDRSGIRWGIDEAHRQAVGQPAERQNTWAFGLDRLILGYAVHGEDTFCGEILPCEGIEGQTGERAGRFLAFCEILFTAHRHSAENKTLLEWQAFLSSLLEALFDADSQEGWQLKKIRDALGGIIEEAQDASMNEEIDFPALLLLLKEKLADPAETGGFPAGGINFCGMLPMRSIPFEVVCLLGMNDGEFPRIEHPPSFDLIAKKPKLGDRNKRNEDRFLFLEALLSARRRLLISYLGQSQQDNSPIPPAGVVEELIDCLSMGFDPVPTDEQPTDQEGRRTRLLGRIASIHPLQPFSIRYFNESDKKLFSFADDYRKALENEEASLPVRATFSASLPAVEEQKDGGIDLELLQRFFRHPVRFFLENRLDLNLREGGEELQDREPLEPDALLRYRLTGELLAAGIATTPPGELFHRWQGEGKLPLGGAATLLFAELGRSIQPLINALAPLRDQHELAPLRCRLALGQGLFISGELRERFPAGLRRLTQGKLHGRTLLATWIDHLFLSLAQPDDQERHTLIFGRGEERESARFLRLRVISKEKARDLLRELISLFDQGLDRPLPFFPKSSWTYAQTLADGKTEAVALAAARACYRGDPFRPGEGNDPWHRQLFATSVPIDQDFSELALRVFAPLIGQLEDGP